LHQKFQLWGDAKGLSNAVLAFAQADTSSASFKQRVPPNSSALFLEPYVHKTDNPNLRVIPSGPLPPNPPELLDSRAMDQFFEAIAYCGADVVIFDAPPLLGISDASILASKVDGTIVVVDITHAHRKNLQQLKALLTQASAHVLGCVVNKQRPSRKDDAYSYYYRTEARHTNGNHKMNNGRVPISPLSPESSMEQSSRAN
jgi:non-specific protein-tyrosine kinase